jgi:hypothetical protein
MQAGFLTMWFRIDDNLPRFVKSKQPIPSMGPEQTTTIGARVVIVPSLIAFGVTELPHRNDATPPSHQPVTSRTGFR